MRNIKYAKEKRDYSLDFIGWASLMPSITLSISQQSTGSMDPLPVNQPYTVTWQRPEKSPHPCFFCFFFFAVLLGFATTMIVKHPAIMIGYTELDGSRGHVDFL